MSSKKIHPNVWGTLTEPAPLSHVFLVLLGSLLIAVGTKINIPLHPVPVTLQSFAVLFISMIYGFRLSLLAVLIYLAAVLTGLPVFTGDITMSAGYLVGFVLAAGLTGFLAENGWSRHIFSAMTAALLGSIVILLSGWIVLAHFLGAGEAFDAGVTPFLLGDALKVILLALLVPGFWRFMEKQLAPPKAEINDAELF
jgi:biotin transport system substrate-specific component